jgi:hypothetical protein
MHINVDSQFTAGALPNKTVTEPPTHGNGVTGTHGAGVKTPIAAVVAACTTGLAGQAHMPNGRMFVMGT